MQQNVKRRVISGKKRPLGSRTSKERKNEQLFPVFGPKKQKNQVEQKKKRSQFRIGRGRKSTGNIGNSYNGAESRESAGGEKKGGVHKSKRRK